MTDSYPRTYNDANYSQVSTTTTLVVKATPGTVHRLIVSGGAATNGDISLVNDSTTVVKILAGYVGGGVIDVGIHFATNIKVTLADAGDEVTVVWT